MPSQNLKINILDVHWLMLGCAQSGRISPATNEITTNDASISQGQLISPEIETEVTQITTFVNEGSTNTGEHVEPSKMPEAMDLATRDMTENSVKGFLERKITLATQDWLATAPAGTLLYDINLPLQYFGQAMIKAKLAGFRYFRCDFRVTIQVNAQPFNAGMLLMAYYPMNRQLTHSPSNEHHFGGITGYRHAILDLAQNTSMDLLIPFSPVLANIDLIEGTGTFGQVALYVYSALTGLVDVDYTIWIAAENVSVEMPTGMPQLLPELPTSGDAQVNLSGEKKRPGTVETISGAVGSVARMAQKIPIPMVSGVATVASTIADAVSGVASMFGWSKPTDPEFATKVEIGYGKYMPNGNGDAKPKSLAFDARASVETPFALANTEEDEMAISTIVARPTYLTRYNFDKTQAPGTLLLSLPTCPTACLKANLMDPVGIVMYNTFLSYLSNLFMAYRGGLRYIFRIIKTPFHSGRIGVMFVPGARVDTTFASIDKSAAYRRIYDLRETSEIEFEVPFVYNAPFKSMRAATDLSNPTKMVYTIPTGMLYIYVVNSLRNPPTCADAIDTIVEVAGGPDFQFAGPMLQPVRSTESRAIVRSTEAPAPVTYGSAQADIVPVSSTAFEMNKHGIGEVVQSLRTVLKRYTTPNFQFSNPFTLLQASWQNTAPTAAALMTQKADMYSWISQLYRFQTGGMRLAVMQSQLAPTLLRFEISAPGLGMFDVDALTSTGQRANAYQFPTMEPLLELGVPMYQLTPAILSIAGDPARSAIVDEGATFFYERMPFNPGTEVTIYNATTNVPLTPDFISTNLALARAVAEDFSFLYLIGPPITAVVSTTPP